MKHSVILKTPIPTWEETADRYGLSKADKRLVASLFGGEESRRSSDSVARRRVPSIFEAGKTAVRKASSRARKTKYRARKAA